MSVYLTFATNCYPPCDTLTLGPAMVNWISSREIVSVEEGLLAFFALWNFKGPFTLSSGAIWRKEAEVEL